MKLIVGLGNPGAKYARNRHNIGYLALDAIAAAHGFALWRSKFQGQIAEGRLGAEKALLLKPETYMNLSGDSVQAAMAFYKLAPADVVVLHDELDLAPGPRPGQDRRRPRRAQRAALDRGAHRPGLHPRAPRHRPSRRQARGVQPRAGDFAKADAEWLDPLLAAVARAAPDLAAGDLARFANAVAPRRRPRPARGRRPPAPDSAPEPRPGERSPLQRLVDRFR